MKSALTISEIRHKRMINSKGAHTMKVIYSDYDTIATITDHRDGTATLKIKIYTGKVVHNKVHKNHKAALAAWRRYCA